MADPDVFTPDWEVELADEPFRLRGLRAGAQAGAAELGATLYELDPGGAVSPYHVHHANEEMLVVLAWHAVLADARGRVPPPA